MFDLLKNKLVDALDKVPPDLHPFYEEKDGKFALAEDPRTQAAAKVISGAHTALGAARTEAATYKKKAVDLSPLAEYGDTPEGIAENFKTKATEYETKIAQGSNAKLDVENVRREMTTSHQRVLEGHKAREGTLVGVIKKQAVDQNAVAAISAQKGNSKLLLPFVRGQVAVVEETVELEGGAKEVVFTPYVVDDHGKKRVNGATGQPMTIPELIAEMKKDPEFAPLFESEAPRGGGTDPQRRKPPGGKVDLENMSTTEKIALGLRQRKLG